MDTHSLRCTHCGAAHKPGTRFCGRCGQSVREADSTPERPVERDQRPSRAAAGLASAASEALSAAQEVARFTQDPLNLKVVPPARWQVVVGELPPSPSSPVPSTMGRELITRTGQAATRLAVEQAERRKVEVIPAAPERPVPSQAGCPTCGAPLRGGARFCGSCGTPLAAPAPTAESRAPQASHCPQCGQPVRPGARFCGSCGQQQS